MFPLALPSRAIVEVASAPLGVYPARRRIYRASSEARAFIEQQRCPESTLKCELRQAFARSEDPVGVHA